MYIGLRKAAERVLHEKSNSLKRLRVEGFDRGEDEQRSGTA